MGLLIAQISTAYDSVLARDRMVNVLWFDDNIDSLITGPDFDGLAEDLANAYDVRLGSTNEISVKIYAADDPKPRPVKGQATINTGQATSYAGPREVALCLSFYAGRNLPSKRGRIYVPMPVGAQGPHGVRPTQAQMDSVLGLATAFSALGGPNIDWVQHSEKLQNHDKVTHAWVDDEWDTVRSRGLRATTRRQTDVSG